MPEVEMFATPVLGRKIRFPYMRQVRQEALPIEMNNGHDLK